MDDQKQVTQEEYTQLETNKNQVQPNQLLIQIDNPLRQLYKQLQSSFNPQAASSIRTFMKYRETRTYHVFVNDKTEYFSSMWQHLLEKLNNQSPLYENDLLGLISNRHTNILDEIMESRLQIEQPRIKIIEIEQQEKGKKVNLLRQQSTQIQRKLLDINSDINQIKQNQNQTSQSRFKPFQINESRVKQYEEFLKKQKKEKEQRAKLIQEYKKKEQEMRLKKQEEQKEAKQKMIKEKKQELLKKMKESEERRNKSKSQRQQRNRQYKFISKSLAQQPPLFKKLEEKYYSRYEQIQNEKRQKVMSERHSMYQQMDNKSLEEHQKKYEEMRFERQRQRKERQQEFLKMIQLQQQEVQNKFKTNYQPDNNFVDAKEVEKKLGLQKKERVKKYIQETVKQRYLPKIDEQKRKEFLRMMQDLGKKKVKKVKKDDGSFEYEQVKPSDPRMVGLEYLQKTKEMAAKMRGKRKNSDQIAVIQNQKANVFDYLGQMRKKGTSKSNRDRLSFMNKKGVSFDQKLKKVELQSEKLEQLAHQKEMKLKFGKFVTSDQILQHKQQIDQHYIDIINMKLKLINHKQE